MQWKNRQKNYNTALKIIKYYKQIFIFNANKNIYKSIDINLHALSVASIIKLFEFAIASSKGIALFKAGIIEVIPIS